ncbi:MAG: alpha-ketoglutarate-dependent dioxygenase AlkB [Actinomycetota bacterium]
MHAALQSSLLDLASGEGGGFGSLATARRTVLARGAWVDVLPGWLHGSDELFHRLVDTVPWRAERRQMYERVVDVPRLLCWYGEADMLPDPLLAEARELLNAHYRDELGEPFRTAGLCCYRDGRDSVAWHGDTIGRGGREDTMVAILSLGSPRRLLLRPRGPGAGGSLGFALGHGDLLVMGGSCQRTWEHAIPKTARGAGPRISVQFRPRDVA